ncbi:MAG: site-2 protease family protein, partial [Microcystaceae cyanobacterium]
ALFNLIPGLPLDGGQILKAIVWKIKGDHLAGMRWASASGKGLGLLGIVIGVVLGVLSGEISAIWIALIGWFVLRNAKAYDQLTQLQETLSELVVSDAMTHEFRVVNANLSLKDFAQEYILSDGNSLFTYYAASDGRYRGLVEIKDLQAIERSRWDEQTLCAIVHPLTAIPSTQETASLVEVINQLERLGEKKLTVLSPAGAVAGIIDRGDIVKAVAAKQNLPIPEAEIKRIKTEGTYPPYLKLAAIAKTLTN